MLSISFLSLVLLLLVVAYNGIQVGRRAYVQVNIAA